MIYFDAAYISKCYLHEPGAEKVIQLAAGSPGLCSSEYGRLEFFSVLHRHLREGHLTKRQVRKVLENFKKDEEEEVWYWLPVTSLLIRAVCQHLQSLPKTSFVRAGDVLHLGTAKQNGFKEIYTNDRHMLSCSKHFGLIGKNIL